MPEDPYAHVYRRIAEHVSRALSVDVDPEEVREILTDEFPLKVREPGVKEAVLDEASEYGLFVGFNV